VSHAIVLPATALVAGVLLSVVEPWPDAIAVGLLLVAVGLACRAYVRREAWRLMVSVIAGCALVGITVGSRAERAARDPPALSALQLDEQDDACLVEGTLTSDAQVAPDATILAVDVQRIRRRQRWLPTAVGISVAVNGQVSDAVVRTWRTGRTVRASVWLHEPSRYLDPGVPDQRLSLARRGVLLTGAVKSPALVEVTRRGTWIDETAASIRDHVRQTVRASIGARSPPAAAIVIAVLIGDRTGLAPADEDVMRDAGTYHVIAISGGNIAILAACLLAIGRVGFVHWRALHVGVAIALAGYALVAGGGSSVARATLTAIVYLGARSLDQQSDPAAAVAVAAATLACWSPLSLVEPAFGLTFGASVAILVIAPRVMALWPLSPMASVPAALLASSIAAETGVLPLSAWFFSRMTVAGLALNFAAIPLMAVVQIGGMIVVAAALVSMDAARVIGTVPSWAAEQLVSSARLVRAAPWAAWRVPPPPLAVLLAYYAAGATLVSRPAWPRTIRRDANRWTIVAGAVWIGTTLWIAAAPSLAAAHPGQLRALSIDVGQGDATLLDLPDGHSLLVDAGGLGGVSSFDVGERVVVPAIWASGLRQIDYLVVTHGDADHAGGAASVLALLRPREIWEGVPVLNHPLLTMLRQKASEARVGWRRLQSDDELQLGGTEIRVLNPPRPDWDRHRVRNADSVVLEVRYGDVSLVLMGDADVSVESAIASELRPAAVRIVKVGHHGSRTSSSVAFIDAARATVGLISCGRHNRFGHPAKEVLTRLEAADVRVFRTDRHGAITLETDGHVVFATAFTGERAAFGIPPVSTVPSPRAQRWWLKNAVEGWLVRTQTGGVARAP